MTEAQANVVAIDFGKRLTLTERQECEQQASECDQIATFLEMDGASRITLTLRNSAAVLRRVAK